MFALLTSLQAQAKDFPERNAVMLQPAGLAVGSGHVSLEYERALGNYFGIAGRYTNISHFLWQGGKNNTPGDDYDWIYDLNGFGAGLSARYYPAGNAPAGFNMGFRTDFLHYTGTYEDRAHNRAAVNANVDISLFHLEFGYKIIIAHAFVIGPFLDAGYPIVSGTDSGANLLGALSFIFGGGLYLGWAF
jgi:hypothetical protein